MQAINLYNQILYSQDKISPVQWDTQNPMDREIKMDPQSRQDKSTRRLRRSSRLQSKRIGNWKTNETFPEN